MIYYIQKGGELMKIINKAYKLRIYPNKEQSELINKTIGSSRFIYNYFLAERIELYETTKESSSYFKDCSKLAQLKKVEELNWLKECDKFSLETSLKDLDNSYQNFFRELKKGNSNQGFPKFKSKKISRLSYRTNCTNNGSGNNNIEIKHNKIKLPKLKWIRFRDGRDLSNISKICNVTISKTKTNKYYASVCVEEVVQEKETTGAMIGIDLGLKEYLITSDNEVIANPRWLRQSEEKLNKLQRNHSRKKKDSKNREKARLKLAKQHEKVSNQRKYFQQVLSTRLTNENQVICLETLKSSNMVKNHKLAKSVSDASWYEFTRQLGYKGTWYGRSVIKIDQFYPSSQLCSNCGEKNSKTKDLGYREYKCNNCGLVIDRDYNASINILNEGIRMLNKS
jgi:putative transposase